MTGLPFIAPGETIRVKCAAGEFSMLVAGTVVEYHPRHEARTMDGDIAFVACATNPSLVIHGTVMAGGPLVPVATPPPLPAYPAKEARRRRNIKLPITE